MLEKIVLERFTAFDSLEIPFSKGINIFIGENGTGKTHVLKAAYCVCEIVKNRANLAEKVNNVFLPSGRKLGRLVKRSGVSSKGTFKVFRRLRDGRSVSLGLQLSNHSTAPKTEYVRGSKKSWFEENLNVAYIPVKDMMANAPGFAALYETREIHFEEVYADIIRKATLGVVKGPIDKQRKKLLERLRKAIDGKVDVKDNEFFLRNQHGKLEFTLLAEGFRKLGLLWRLIQNGTLQNKSILFWDEPESNLNPKITGIIVSILLELQRMGIQIFLATHDYVVLKEFDLQTKENDEVVYHSLYRDTENDTIKRELTKEYANIHPNAIDETFGNFIDQEIKRAMKGKIQ